MHKFLKSSPIYIVTLTVVLAIAPKAVLAQFPEPVAKWSFETSTELGKWHGKAKIATSTLNPPRFPQFSSKNQSAYFKTGQYLRIKDNELAKDNLRFDVGDTITMEAWVKPEMLRNGGHAYIIGKGRTGNKGFVADNQNYALRLTGKNGTALLSFLFRSRPGKNQTSEFHRWTSKTGFLSGTSWHHVAVTYTFGKKHSLVAFVDGKKVTGTWDMGGATDRPPISDADDLLIGTSQNGTAGNSFQGWMDDIAIYRQSLSPELIAKKAEREPFVPTINVKNVPADKVLVQIIEKDIPQADVWPEVSLQPSEEYDVPAFGFSRAPHKYIDTGIRADRPNPYMLRAMSRITLPEGKHRILLRARGATRLWIDGKIFLQTPFRPPITDGHNAIPTDYLDLAPDFRFAPPGNREKWTYLESSGKAHVIVMETLVGAKRGNGSLRPELGETVVAWSPDGHRSFQLLAPKSTFPFTDAGWEGYAEQERLRIEAMEKVRRAEVFAKENGYWQMRREAADHWLKNTPEVAVPKLPSGFPAHNAIDHFLAQKIAGIQSSQNVTKGKIDFHKKILPILETKCYSCHQGKKVRGGLRLDSRDQIIRGGDSEIPAVIAGHPEKSLLLARITSEDAETVMPPRGDRLNKQDVALIKQWIQEGAHWPVQVSTSVKLTPLTDDLTFLRRAYLDTTGVVPTPAEVKTFLDDDNKDKRAQLIDRLLADSRWADRWVGYWQDVLAENPNILNPTLNNTGPFRFWIYEAMLDNKPMDIFATELIRMRGSHYQGGPAGFAMASQNDVPMAQKGVIVSGALLGVTMTCARCHDAPAHVSTQEDLFQLASLLAQKDLNVPKTSSVPQDKLHANGRKPLIQVTLRPGTTVKQAWPFADLVKESDVANLLPENPSSRERLAVLITAPQNERFAEVMVNRIWQRFMGRGIVSPVSDWENGKPSHPQLLRWLAREFVRSGYDMKHMARLIMNSHAYQRAIDPNLKETNEYFAAPARRRLEAEQIVDSLFHAVGKELETEEINLDVDSGRDMRNSLNLGRPRRAWEFSSTSNERDRPSLSLPRVQAVADVLEAFGWRGSRQDPRSERDTDPNVLQPAILANGPVGIWLTRLSDDHGIVQLARQEQSVEELVDTLFLKILTRPPTAEEKNTMVNYLKPGYEQRVVANPPPPPKEERKPPRYVSWSNHLTEEANEIKIAMDAAARRGAPPTRLLTPEWRSRMEDVLWALCNSPEFVFRP